MIVSVHTEETVVNCEWNDWKVSECSKSCGEGTRSKIRSVKVVAANGGQECVGPRNVSESCNILSCPGMALRKIIV